MRNRSGSDREIDGLPACGRKGPGSAAADKFAASRKYSVPPHRPTSTSRTTRGTGMLLVAVCGALCNGGRIDAQHRIDWLSVDGASGRSASATWVVAGTLGQADAGVTGDCTLLVRGGFWPAVTHPPAERIFRSSFDEVCP